MSGDPSGLAAEVNDAIFDVWGRDATYIDADKGIRIDCVVVTDTADRDVNVRGSGLSRPVMQGNVFRLRASEVPAPLQNAVITRKDDGAQFRIISAPKAEDLEHSVFRFTVSPINP